MQTLEKKLITKTLFFGGLITFILIVFGRTRIGLGFLAGSLVSILNFKLLIKSIKSLNPQHSQRRIKTHFFLQYLIRYGIMGLVLYLALRFKGMQFFIGTAVGLFMIRFSIFVDTFLARKR
jgi:hypothetical protein